MVGGFALGEAVPVLGLELAQGQFGSCAVSWLLPRSACSFSVCSPAGVTGGNSNTSRVVLKMRRGSGEAVVEGEMETGHRVDLLSLRVLRSGFMVAALIYISFKAV